VRSGRPCLRGPRRGRERGEFLSHSLINDASHFSSVNEFLMRNTNDINDVNNSKLSLQMRTESSCLDVLYKCVFFNIKIECIT